ncbi:MAG: TatD family hydrolase [Chitinophagales bacterium]|nr:TatD family hydrolase [Chitinophagales bacterium]
MEPYIDIHTHQLGGNGFAIINRYERFEEASNGVVCSLGIHPWYIRAEVVKQQLDELEQYASLDNVIAIGECGLDKVTETSLDLQVGAFTAQISLANTLKKPLIIHCVRAYVEVLQLLKEHRVSVPVIFHGFNKHAQLARQIVDAGYYLSFGAAILKEGSSAATSIASVPVDRIFLETDDAGVDIKDIYERAAMLLKSEEDALILQLQKNFQAVFKI